MALPVATRVNGQRHCDLIAEVVDRHGANTAQFRKSLVAYLRRDLGMAASDVDDLRIPDLRPDAWLITDDAIIVWEVEVTNPLDARRLSRYARLWFDLDGTDHYLNLDLRTVDRYGLERQVDLCTAFHRSLRSARVTCDGR